MLDYKPNLSGTTIAEVFLIFVLPVFLIQLKLVPTRLRFLLLVVVLLASLVLSYFEKLSFFQLGIRSDNFNISIIPYTLLTIVGLVFIILVAKWLNFQPVLNWRKSPHFQYMFIILSVAQEFLYRSFLMIKLEVLINSPFLIIMLNTLLFTYLHVIYPNKITNLAISFTGGLAFATIYYFYPNLILISLSHSVLNFAVVYYGLVGFGKKPKN